MKNLVVGNTSQLAHYFQDTYCEKISSRNIDYDYYKNKKYDRIFLCFAEQRTFLEDKTSDIFFETNIKYTLEVAEFFIKRCDTLVVYGTAELWNNYEGAIDVNLPFNFNSTPYIRSKEDMCLVINYLRKEHNNLIILHPVNFNSVYRKEGFLFSKIFDSIIYKKRIEIGDTYFYRDIVHPKYVVERSLLANNDEIVGSGRLVFINDFIRDLYLYFDMPYKEYVHENFDNNLSNQRKIYYMKSQYPLFSYSKLLDYTLKELYDARIQNKIS